MDYQQCFLSSLAVSSFSSFFLVDNNFFPVPLLSQYCLAKPCSLLPLFWTPSELNLKNKIKQSSRGSDGWWVFHHKTFKSWILHPLEKEREIYMHPGLIIIPRNTVNVYTESLKDSGEWHKEEEEEFTSETESRIDTHLMGFSWNLTSNCNCFPHMATIYRMIFWAIVPKRFRFSYFMSRLLISTKHKQKHLLCPPCHHAAAWSWPLFSNANTENQFVPVLFSCRILEAPSVMLQ